MLNILDGVLIFLAIWIFLIGVLLSQDPAYSIRETLILIGLGKDRKEEEILHNFRSLLSERIAIKESTKIIHLDCS